VVYLSFASTIFTRDSIQRLTLRVITCNCKTSDLAELEENDCREIRGRRKMAGGGYRRDSAQRILHASRAGILPFLPNLIRSPSQFLTVRSRRMKTISETLSNTLRRCYRSFELPGSRRTNTTSCVSKIFFAYYSHRI